MKAVRSTKLRVTFAENSVVDFGEVLKSIGGLYDFGYMGISEGGGPQILYLQTSSYNVRMVPRKIQKFCEQFGDIVDVSQFSTIPAGVTSEVGMIRKNGRRSELPTPSSKKKLSENTKTPRNEYELNALGEEDISHITVEMLDEMMGSEEVYLKTALDKIGNTGVLSNVMERWSILRQCQRSSMKGQETKGHEVNDYNAFDGNAFLEKHPMTYDDDSDSEENVEARRVLKREFLLQANVLRMYARFIETFEELLYEDLKNSNVKASPRLGYFEYFKDGHWIAKRVSEDYFSTVISGRVKKVKEVVANLEMSPFLEGQLLGIGEAYAVCEEDTVIKRDVVRRSVLNAKNQMNVFRAQRSSSGTRRADSSQTHC